MKLTPPHRIAGRAVILQDDRMLLLRYRRRDGSTYIHGPGGTLEPHENVIEAIVRETKDEIGVIVHPQKVLMIEDLVLRWAKTCCILMLCDFVSGEPALTDEAEEEGITEVRWFRKAELRNEEVTPAAIMEHDWNAFKSESWQVLCLPSFDGRR